MLATFAGSLHLLPQTSRPCVQFGGRSNTVPVSKVRAHQRCQHNGYTGVLSNVLGEASKPRATTDRAHSARARRDPGHWDLSPEWWGTQAGGWGHDAGVPVFMQHSHYGNGQVTVTAHHASGQATATGYSQTEFQWRVLRFNETRQSVSRVSVQEAGAVHAVASCLAFEYLKTMASAAAAIIGLSSKLDCCLSAGQFLQQKQQQQRQPLSHTRGELQPLQHHQNLVSRLPDRSDHVSDHLSDQSSDQHPDSRNFTEQHSMPMSTKHHHHAQGHMQQSHQTAAQQQQHAQQAACHALCLGLGGGSLPLFLSHHFPGMFVQAVELDPVVLAAATQEMGLPAYRGNLALHQAEAGDFVMKLATDVTKGVQPPVDLLFVDVFDGEDNVPASLCSADSAVLEAMAAALHPEHGTVIMNLHGGGVPMHNALVALFTSLVSGHGSKGYHASTEQGRAVQDIASVLRESILHSQPARQGSAMTLKVAHQSNVIIVVSRALMANTNDMKTRLSRAGQHAAEQAGFLFDAGTRCSSGLTSI